MQLKELYTSIKVGDILKLKHKGSGCKKNSRSADIKPTNVEVVEICRNYIRTVDPKKKWNTVDISLSELISGHIKICGKSEVSEIENIRT
jgi:hypothetical protein